MSTGVLSLITYYKKNVCLIIDLLEIESEK